jgi:hypothetical protein
MCYRILDVTAVQTHITRSQFLKKKKKLQKLAKVYLHTSFLGIMNNRELFTNHGLHCNKIAS